MSEHKSFCAKRKKLLGSIIGGANYPKGAYGADWRKPTKSDACKGCPAPLVFRVSARTTADLSCCVPEKQDRLERGKLICKKGRQNKWARYAKNTRKSKLRKYSKKRRCRTTFRIRCASMGATIRRIIAGRQNMAVWTPRAYKGFESLIWTNGAKSTITSDHTRRRTTNRQALAAAPMGAIRTNLILNQ